MTTAATGLPGFLGPIAGPLSALAGFLPQLATPAAGAPAATAIAPPALVQALQPVVPVPMPNQIALPHDFICEGTGWALQPNLGAPPQSQVTTAPVQGSDRRPEW
jgi:hypothetical protein